MTCTLQARVLWSFLGLGRLRGRGGGRAREWHRAIWWRPATRNARRAAASAGTFYAGARSLSLWATCVRHGDGGQGVFCGPSSVVPISVLAPWGLPPTVDLMRGGIVLVEAFGHVETSHFRATFRLELCSQQRGP